MSEQAASGVAERLASVRRRIEVACARVGRSADAVRLIAVSKGHDARAIAEAHAAGQREFGENYAQELIRKADQLSDLSELRFRFIGRLQRNKARQLVQVSCCIDSVDSLALAQALGRHAHAAGRELEALIQVNVDREAQKSGALPEVVADLAQALRAIHGLRLCGLMAIPRASDEPERLRGSFRALRLLGERIGVHELSMGMSADLEVAVEEGATMVRVGTAIFGPRPTALRAARDDSGGDPSPKPPA
jgi:PLP dependent protein